MQWLDNGTLERNVEEGRAWDHIGAPYRMQDNPKEDGFISVMSAIRIKAEKD